MRRNETEKKNRAFTDSSCIDTSREPGRQSVQKAASTRSIQKGGIESICICIDTVNALHITPKNSKIGEY